MTSRNEDVKEQIRTVLKRLSQEEQRLLSCVLKTEADHLSQKNPRLSDELLKQVKQVIK